MPRDRETVEEFASEEVVVAAPAPVAAAPELKPYGQNPGDVVDANEAKGGRYEALGAGKMRRLAD